MRLFTSISQKSQTPRENSDKEKMSDADELEAAPKPHNVTVFLKDLVC